MPSLPFRLFRPILPGATLRGRLIGCVGALFAIGLTGLVSSLFAGGPHLLPFIVAPMGASAVLLFAVPASPLAQPWPVIGGNTIAALVGITVTKVVPDPFIASGLAVALAIAVMSLTRSLHPPGGAAALTTVVGGQAVASAGFAFAFVPVALNSVLMVVVAIIFHRLAGTTYPHRHVDHAPSTVPAHRPAFTDEDIDVALAEMHEAFDIDRGDLAELLDRIETAAAQRTKASLPARS